MTIFFVKILFELSEKDIFWILIVSELLFYLNWVVLSVFVCEALDLDGEAGKEK
jgi:hypothetical protein